MVPMFGTFESSDLSDYRGVLEGFLCRFCAEHPYDGNADAIRHEAIPRH